MTAVFITGAGSGIGRALVERSIVRGDLTIAGVYSASEGQTFEPTANLHVVRLDVSNSDSVVAAFTQIDKWLAGSALDVVINCAGCCPLGALEVLDPQVILDTLNVNAVGSARILQAALPRLRGHGGRIGLVTSLWGRVAGPMLSAYCASKFAIEAIADATRREIDGQDVSIILLEPGVVRTPLVAEQVRAAKQGIEDLPVNYKQIYTDLYQKYHDLIARNAGGGLSADEAAQQIETAIFVEKPLSRAKIGKDAKAVSLLARLLPDRALDTMFRMILR